MVASIVGALSLTTSAQVPRDEEENVQKYRDRQEAKDPAPAPENQSGASVAAKTDSKLLSEEQTTAEGARVPGP
jgi:DNA gyrase/topoisomerase IV subunit B